MLKDIDVDVVAVLNDTTGTMVSCAHRNKECRVGLIVGSYSLAVLFSITKLILGTGTNACYMETIENVELFADDQEHHLNQVVVNTELGAFGDNQTLEFFRTDWDRDVDDQSTNPGKQM